MGLKTFTPVGELLRYNYFPVCGLATRQVWDLILSRLRPSYRLVVASSLSVGVGYFFFLIGSSVVVFFVDGCSAVSCDFGVLLRRGELTSFYSSILPASPIHLNFIAFTMP